MAESNFPVEYSYYDDVASPLDDLTEKQRTFVERFIQIGGGHGAGVEAALLAGYGNGVNRNAATAAACHNLRNPKILKALKYLAQNQVNVGIIVATKALLEIAEGGTESNRLKAAEKLLGFAGIIVRNITEHHEHLHDHRTPAQIKSAILEKAQRLGIELKSDIVDAEFTDVPTAKMPLPREEWKGPPGRKWHKVKLMPGKIKDWDRPKRGRPLGVKNKGPAPWAEEDLEAVLEADYSGLTVGGDDE